MASVRPHTVASDQPLAFMPPLAVYNLDEADVEGQRKRFDLYDEVRHYSAAAWPPCCLTALPPCCCGALLTGAFLLNQAMAASHAASIRSRSANACQLRQARHLLFLGYNRSMVLHAIRFSAGMACSTADCCLLLVPPMQEARRMLAKRLPVPAYDHLLKLSHTFNLLDARGAVGVTGERLTDQQCWTGLGRAGLGWAGRVACPWWLQPPQRAKHAHRFAPTTSTACSCSTPQRPPDCHPLVAPAVPQSVPTASQRCAPWLARSPASGWHAARSRCAVPVLPPASEAAERAPYKGSCRACTLQGQLKRALPFLFAVSCGA